MRGHEEFAFFDEDGKIIPATDFDYPEFDFSGASQRDLAKLDPADLDKAIQAFTKLLEWVWADAFKRSPNDDPFKNRNLEGVKIRAIIVCWVFLKSLRKLSLTQVARATGKKKQSISRFMTRFKKDWPKIRTSHMKTH